MISLTIHLPGEKGEGPRWFWVQPGAPWAWRGSEAGDGQGSRIHSRAQSHGWRAIACLPGKFGPISHFEFSIEDPMASLAIFWCSSQSCYFTSQVPQPTCWRVTWLLFYLNCYFYSLTSSQYLVNINSWTHEVTWTLFLIITRCFTWNISYPSYKAFVCITEFEWDAFLKNMQCIFVAEASILNLLFQFTFVQIFSIKK